MMHSLICSHCGKVVGIETRQALTRTPLVAHLTALHREVAAFDALPRWAQLLEHYWVVPPHSPLMPRVLQA